MKALVLIIGVLLLLLPSLVQGKIRGELELLLYFPFDEDVGKVVKDKSDTEANGELVGNWKRVDGQIGKAVYFLHNPGPEGMVRTKKDPVFAFEGEAEITLMAWVNVDAARPGANRGIIFNRQGNAINYAMTLWSPNGGRDLQFYWSDNGDQHRARSLGGTGVVLEKWMHVAVTNTFGKAGALKFYINGKLQKMKWTAGDGALKAKGSAGPITIGGFDQFAEPFQGTIDEVMIWRGTFTEQDINEIMLGIDVFLGVDPQGKLATTWGNLKQSP
jgi:hypothetical protein